MQITKQAIIAASAEDVWRVLGHEFEQIGVWAAAVPASQEATGTAPPAGCPVGGRTCQTTMGMFPEVEERIVAYDEARRTLTYEPVRGMPGFVASARNTWRVVAVDESRSEVSFAATVATRGIAGRLIGIALRLQMSREGVRVLHDLRHYVQHGMPSPRKQRQLNRLVRASHDGHGARTDARDHANV